MSYRVHGSTTQQNRWRRTPSPKILIIIVTGLCFIVVVTIWLLCYVVLLSSLFCYHDHHHYVVRKWPLLLPLPWPLLFLLLLPFLLLLLLLLLLHSIIYYCHRHDHYKSWFVIRRPPKVHPQSYVCVIVGWGCGYSGVKFAYHKTCALADIYYELRMRSKSKTQT